MWRNYLTVGIRALAKNRTYSIINIAGLAIGMAACLMILLFIRYETSYDRDLAGAANAYQFQTYYSDRQTGETGKLQMAAYVAKDALKKDFPQIDNIVYAMGAGPIVTKDGRAYTIDDGHLVDGNLLDILQLPLVAGDARTALSRPGDIILPESEAVRFFGGTAAAMGKTITMVSRGKPIDFKVTGVLKQLSRQSHFKTGFVARIDMTAYNAEQPEFLRNWGWQSGWIYARMRPGTDIAALNAQMPAFEKRNIADEVNGTQRSNAGDDTDFGFVNVQQVHLGKAQDGAMTPGNDPKSIATFGAIALMILAMACVNFTNLATARASQRAREVALRKVLGASRGQLVAQFLCEAVLISAIAMLIALALVELALPAAANFLQADLVLHYFGRDGIAIPVVLLTLAVGLAAGAYPAFFLARFEPARVLKANKSTAGGEGSGRLRNGLVVAQFTVSIGLIICTLIVHAQTVYARTSDPGYKRDGLIQIEAVRRLQTWPHLESFIREVNQLPGVVSTGRTGIGIATRDNTNNGIQVPGRDKAVNVGRYDVDDGFFRTTGIKLVAGRLFDRNRPMDDATTPFPEQPAAERALAARGVNVVANELAVKRLGFKDAQAAIGKQVLTTVSADYGGIVPTTIIGVVANSRFRSIRDPLDPILFQMSTIGHSAMLVRYTSSDPAAVNNAIENLWKRTFPDVPYDGKYSEDIVGKLYAADDARAQMFGAFALLAVVIGCLGLFGLAAFTAERRTKEIGIRKVLGARTRDIVQLLVWQFSRPVVIANIIAWPVAWWLMRDWLDSFDDRITLGPVPFVLAAALALGIAVVTVAGHAFRVARSNPIHALRYE